MASVNKVTIVGNLGRNQEVRYLTGRDAIANIALATSHLSKDRTTGAQKDLVEWHRNVLFARQAEIASLYLRKGTPVYVEGRLQARRYTDKDGIARYATNIIAENMQMLGARTIGTEVDGVKASGSDAVQDTSLSLAPSQLDSGDAADSTDDQLPF